MLKGRIQKAGLRIHFTHTSSQSTLCDSPFLEKIAEMSFNDQTEFG